MLKGNKKILSILACAGMLASVGVSVTNGAMINQHTVQAAKKKRKSVGTRSYGVDVANYQSASVKGMANAGAKFAIVKVSEGTGYRNPKASAQIASAKASGMLPMAYHFALFGANSGAAVSEANYAASSAKAYGLPAGSYIACDWKTGDGNNVNGGKNASANAIIAFMNQIKRNGYKPLLYSGASLLNNNINTAKVTSAFPNSLWVASYASAGRIDSPNFAYFPSMNGIIIWQFTDNWRGLNVDGNISLLPLSMNGTSSQAPKAKVVKTKKHVMVNASTYSKKGKLKSKIYKVYSKVTVYGGLTKINGTDFYRVGKDTYIKAVTVDGTKRVVNKNAQVYNKEGKLANGVAAIAHGSTIATYGEKKNIAGVEYYKINKDRYVRVSDFN